jgi:hypothetical protein
MNGKTPPAQWISNQSAPVPTPQKTKGRAERFINTLIGDWACAMHFLVAKERNRWLPRHLPRYMHAALHGAQ